MLALEMSSTYPQLRLPNATSRAGQMAFVRQIIQRNCSWRLPKFPNRTQIIFSGMVWRQRKVMIPPLLSCRNRGRIPDSKIEIDFVNGSAKVLLEPRPAIKSQLLFSELGENLYVGYKR